MIKNIKGFTLIELLVVVAIIGILAAVGVVGYNGYTTAAKRNAVKANFAMTVKYVKSEIMKCELNVNNKILEGLVDCKERAKVIAGNAPRKEFRENFGISLAQAIKLKNPYKTEANGISVHNLCDVDTMVGYVCVFYDLNGYSLNKDFLLEACYEGPCASHGGSTRNEANKLFAEIDLF